MGSIPVRVTKMKKPWKLIPGLFCCLFGIFLAIPNFMIKNIFMPVKDFCSRDKFLWYKFDTDLTRILIA